LSNEFAVSEKLILVKENVGSREEILSRLAGLLEKGAYVKDTFLQALLDREKEYPTGLQTHIIGVAIPHTDVEHVNRAAIAIATLVNPVVFQAMGDPDSEIDVDIVIMMAIKEHSNQMEMLRKIIMILQNKDALTRIQQSEDPWVIKDAVLEHLASQQKQGQTAQT